MAWRIEHLLMAGELDNTQLGWTLGWLELKGIDERLLLKLAGNCPPDLAGWKFRIIRIEPELKRDLDVEESPNYLTVHRDQSGHVGDITADQMIKHFDIPTHELVKRLRNGESPPFAWRKCLYLEWFGNVNGRVVIQSTRLEVERLGERVFELTEAQWRQQRQTNRDELNYFMHQVSDAFERHDPSS